MAAGRRDKDAVTFGALGSLGSFFQTLALEKHPPFCWHEDIIGVGWFA